MMWLSYQTRVVAGCLGLALCLVAGPLPAQIVMLPTDVVRVEEDWELVVSEPEPGGVAPQVTTAFSALGNIQGLHATFELNHQSLPEFVPGGLQLQLWNGETSLASRKFPNPAIMSTSSETVTWTQAIQVADGQLTFEIIAGSSATWGAFGSEGYLRQALPTTLSNLNSYSPVVSVDHSGVGYAGNRVSSLVIKRVRVFTYSGDIYVDETDRSVSTQ